MSTRTLKPSRLFSEMRRNRDAPIMPSSGRSSGIAPGIRSKILIDIKRCRHLWPSTCWRSSCPGKSWDFLMICANRGPGQGVSKCKARNAECTPSCRLEAACRMAACVTGFGGGQDAEGPKVAYSSRGKQRIVAAPGNAVCEPADQAPRQRTRLGWMSQI